MAETYVGRHRLIVRKNLTLRATVWATVALIAVILMAMQSGTPTDPPLADAVTTWQQTVVKSVDHTLDKAQAEAATTTSALAGADSGKKKTTTAATRRTVFSLETCNT